MNLKITRSGIWFLLQNIIFENFKLNDKKLTSENRNITITRNEKCLTTSDAQLFFLRSTIHSLLLKGTIAVYCQHNHNLNLRCFSLISGNTHHYQHQSPIQWDCCFFSFNFSDRGDKNDNCGTKSCVNKLFWFIKMCQQRIGSCWRLFRFCRHPASSH